MRVIGFIFGCRHAHASWPQRDRTLNHALPQTGRQTCADCGAWRSYDFGTMKRGPWCSPKAPVISTRNSHSDRTLVLTVSNGRT